MTAAHRRTLAALACIYLLFGSAAASLGADAPVKAPTLAQLKADVAAHPALAAARLRLANELVRRKQLAPALKVLAPAAASAEVVLLRSKILLWSGAYPEAESVLSAAPEDIRDSFDARICMVDILLAMGRFEAAKQAVDAVLATAPTHPDARALDARALAGLLAKPVPVSTEVVYRAEWIAMEVKPEVIAAQQDELLRVLRKVPEASRASTIEAIESVWAATPAREHFLFEAERGLEMRESAIRRGRGMIALEVDKTPLAAAIGDLACGVAWGKLGKGDAKGTREVALAVLDVAKPTCLLLALAQAELSLSHFDEATKLFDSILEREPENRDVILGATQAALAQNQVERADALLKRLEADDGSNHKEVQGLRLSFYIRGADHALQEFLPVKAEKLARAALAQDPTSVDAALLLSAALQNQHRPQEALPVLRKAIAVTPKSGRIKSALARLPGKFDHAALAREAIELSKDAPAPERFDIELSLGDAFILDRQLDNAAAQFESIAKREPERQDPELRLAQVSMHRGDFFLARRQLQASWAKKPSFDATLQLADASHALNLERDAFRFGELALLQKPGQPDAAGFMDRMLFSHAPVAALRLLHSWDNGTNQAWEEKVAVSADVHPDLRVLSEVIRRDVRTVVSDESGYVLAARGGLRHQVGARLALTGLAGVAYMKPKSDSGGAVPFVLARADVRIAKAHRLSIGYEADTFSYTAGMVANHLGMHNFGLTGNGPILGNLSFYTALSEAWLTDGNRRSVAFGSLYYILWNSPVIKVGLNGQALGFSQTSPRSYFSPARLLNTEVFGEVLCDAPDARILYGALAAGGLQRIEDLLTQTTYRFGAQLGFRPVRSLKILGKGQITNSASTTISGFQYFDVELNAELTFK